MIKVSVPGKIHLLGEHSVVYGKPALLSSINLRVFVTVITDSPSPSLRANSEAISINGFWIKSGMTKEENEKIQHLQDVLENVIKKKYSIKKIPPYQIKIKSDLPIGSGLGSSAALSVALTKALFQFLKIPADERSSSSNENSVFEIALAGEKIFHGNPSGGDVAAVLNEGLIWFIKKSDDVKIIKPLHFSISKKLQNFFLIDSGKPVETTKEMVELVRVKHEGSRGKFDAIFDDQEELTKQLVGALEIGNSALMIQIIKAGERNLEKLGVVGKKALNIIREIEKIGGAAKISGAGGIKDGSGMILAYLSNFSKIQALSKKNGWEVIKINLGKNE